MKIYSQNSSLLASALDNCVNLSSNNSIHEEHYYSCIVYTYFKLDVCMLAGGPCVPGFLKLISCRYVHMCV